MKALFGVAGLAAALACVSACGSSAEEESSGGAGGASGAGGDASTASGGSWPGVDGGDGAAGSVSGATANQYDPCATAACWTAPALGACGSSTVSEDFGSGLYGVHRYLVMVPAGAELEISVTRTAGSWQPLLIVHDEQGTTVFDGSDAQSTGTLSVSALPVSDPDVRGVRIDASARTHLGVYLTGSEAMTDSGEFTGTLPAEAEYALEARLDCTAPPALAVRGVKLSARQELWIRYIAEQVVPKVPVPESERIDKSAYVAWWALKEGVLDTNNPLSYSNCSIPPDKHIGPVELCPNPKNAWQVGLSGVQATYNTLAGIEPLAQQAYAGQTIEQILAGAAVRAGFGESTALGQTVATSTDRLRLSWLLRDGPVGFAAQYSPVYNQCFVSQETWCFGTGWPSSASFAPSQAAAKEAVADLKGIFQSLSP